MSHRIVRNGRTVLCDRLSLKHLSLRPCELGTSNKSTELRGFSEWVASDGVHNVTAFIRVVDLFSSRQSSLETQLHMFTCVYTNSRFISPFSFLAWVNIRVHKHQCSTSHQLIPYCACHGQIRSSQEARMTRLCRSVLECRLVNRRLRFIFLDTIFTHFQWRIFHRLSAK